LIKNWNERIGLDALARCCALLQIAITDLLYYRPSNDCPFDLPIPHLIPEPLTIYGRIEVVLGRVLAEYENVFGEALGDLTDLIQLPLQRHRIEALVAGRPIQEQIDLPILERTIYVLTQAASQPTPPARQFDAWLRKRGYTPGTVGLVLKYEPPAEPSMQTRR